MRVRFSFLTIAMALARCAIAQSAAINGEITGTVTDDSGASVCRAHVRVVNQSTGFERETLTDDAGLYRFTLLPIGRYGLKVVAAGFAEARSLEVAVRAGSVVSIPVTLRVAGSRSQVEVVANVAGAAPGQISVGNTLDHAATANLPLVSRNPFNFILFQPNVSGRPTTEFGVPRRVNANGFNGRINYQLDGSNNTESDRAGIRLIPLSNSSIDEVQQVSNGFAPEFGDTVGTVFNAITRSGSNDLHGEALYLFRRTTFSARPMLLAPTAPTPEVNVDSFVADAGGWVIRDRLFYFGSFERVKRDLPAPVTVPADVIAALGLPASYADPIPFRQAMTFYMGRLDWMMNLANRLMLRYNHHANDSPFNYGTGPGGQNLVSRTYEFVDRSHVAAVQLVSTVSSNAVNEFRAQYAKRAQSNNPFSATGQEPAITVAGVANFGGPIDVGFRYTETTPEVVDNFSVVRGAHQFKVGLDARWIRDRQVAATGALYTFPSVTAYRAAVAGVNPMGYISFIQSYGAPTVRYNSVFAGGFAQDTWQLRRNLVVAYGLRYDVYRPPSANADAPFSFSRHFRTDKNNFAPRLGAAWSIGKEQRTVVRASSGIFYDPLQTDQYRLALLQNGRLDFFRISVLPIQPFAPAFPTTFTSLPTGFSLPPQDIMTVAPDFGTLYSFNANLSISREVRSGFVTSASYLYTKGTRLPVYRNINLVPSGAYLADGRPIFSPTARLYGAFNNILSAESVGNSNYNALNLTVEKSWGELNQVYATYSWSHAIDDAPEQNNIDSTAFLSDPTNRRRDRGNSVTDKRHVLSVGSVFGPQFRVGSRFASAFLNGNLLSLTLQASSGDVFNVGSNRPLNQDSSEPASFQRPLFIGRNTLRAGRIVEINARYSRFLRLRENLALEAFVESTNPWARSNGPNKTCTSCTAVPPCRQLACHKEVRSPASLLTPYSTARSCFFSLRCAAPRTLSRKE